MREVEMYEKLSLEELTLEVRELDAAIEALRVKKRAAARLMDDKLSAAEAKRKLEGMNDKEKAALLRVLAPNGIKSAEEIGNIGG